jgi:hypothetical protein
MLLPPPGNTHLRLILNENLLENAHFGRPHKVVPTISKSLSFSLAHIWMFEVCCL